MIPLLNRFIKDESGATAVEYGLIAALMASALIAALNSFSGSLSTTFTSIGTSMTTAAK